MSDGHFREVCECGTVIKQCRCFNDGNKTETRGVCARCRDAAKEIPSSWMAE